PPLMAAARQSGRSPPDLASPHLTLFVNRLPGDQITVLLLMTLLAIGCDLAFEPLPAQPLELFVDRLAHELRGSAEPACPYQLLNPGELSWIGRKDGLSLMRARRHF